VDLGTEHLKKSFLMHIGPEVKGKTIDIETSDHCKMTLQIVVQW
jgi:hypothetical protein